MRRTLITLLSCTLSTLVSAAEAPVLAQFTIPDGAQLTQHLKAGIIGRLWNEPALANLRTKLDEMMPAVEAELGFSPLALPESISALQATFYGLPPGASAEEAAAYSKAPDIQLQVGLGKLAPQIFAQIKKSSGPQSAAANIPGATEAITLSNGELTLVRINDVLVLASKAQRLIPGQIAPAKHDLTFRFNGHDIMETVRSGMPPAEFKKTEGALKAMHRFLVPVTAHVDFTPKHVASRIEAKTSLPFLKQVDLALCARLPATAYSVNALGFDGAILWEDLIAPLLAVAAEQEKKSVADLLKPANDQLAAAGATVSLTDLVTGLRGTLLFAQTPGAPFPGYTLAIPRSPALDQVLGIVLKMIGNDLPAEGEALPLAFPNLPLPINLVRDTSHWVVSTDTALATTWTTTADGGWLGSPLGKLAQEKSGGGALMLAATDTAAELRSMQGYIGMGLGVLPLEPKEKQSVMRAFSMLIANAGLGYEVMQQRGDLLVSEGQSMFGGSSTSIAVMAVIAAIAIPNLLESRVVSNESAAATTLKSGVFPAQVQFQGGGYRDLDKDNVGEYGFFHELAGGKITGNADDITVSLLAPGEDWNKPLPERSGYRFAMYLADGAGGAIGVNDKAPEKKPDHANDGERYFVAYAWPIDDSQGRKAFAITHAGMVYTMPADQLDGAEPAWNTVFGGEGKGWQDQPVWQLHQRRDGGPRPAAEPQPAPEVNPAF